MAPVRRPSQRNTPLDAESGFALIDAQRYGHAAPSTFLFLHKDIEPLFALDALYRPSGCAPRGRRTTGDGLWPVWVPCMIVLFGDNTDRQVVGAFAPRPRSADRKVGTSVSEKIGPVAQLVRAHA